MRKILAGFMATSMIVAMASATTFAANQAASADFSINSISPISTPTLDKDSRDSTAGPNLAFGVYFNSTSGWGADSSHPFGVTVQMEEATLELFDSRSNRIGRTTIDLSDSASVEATGNIALRNSDTPTTGNQIIAPSIDGGLRVTNAQVLAALNNKTFSHLQVDGKLYSGKVLVNQGTGDVRIVFDQSAQIPNMAGITLSISGSQSLSMRPVTYNLSGNPTDYTAQTNFASAFGVTFTTLNQTNGAGDITANVSGNLNIADVVVCDGEGNPIPLTENPSGVDNDINDNDGVQSDTTVYFMIKETKVDGTKSFYDDDNYYKIRVNKGDNAKQVKSVDVVYKNFKNNLYDAVQGTKNDPVLNTSGRHRFVKVVLNPNYTTDEFKITLDMRITPTADAVDKVIAASDDELKIKDFSFYMKNIERAADNDWRVGINGMMLKPLENDWNDVTWFDEDGDVAHMKFFADSDIDSFYSKLSTKWEHADYASYFNDQDAFIFNFTGSPKLSSTSRADLEIYNPFVDEDGNETIDPSTAVIYQVIDGDLYDITDSFQYKEAENGEMAFTTRTRFLGTYIICEKAVEEAVADETVPDELTPDTTEAPEDVTPDSNAGGKQPANTGKYL